MADKTAIIKKAQAESVQVHPDTTKGEGSRRLAWIHSRGPLLPGYGTRQRERALNLLYLFDYNWMVKAAFSGAAKKLAATPWEILGPDDISVGAKAWYYKQVGSLESDRPDIEYWQEILRQANFGAGWADMAKMCVIDYLKQDAGSYWEIIAPGIPLEAPTGAVTGIAHLDSLRCIPSGDPIYPVYYLNEKNEWHKLHHTRVVHMVDMPSGDVTKRGYGVCALSRAVVVSNREINMARYIDSYLDDKPPPGVVVASGMVNQERDHAMKKYKAEQSTDEQPLWGNQLWMFAADATQAASLDFQSFVQAPEKFDFEKYTQIDINSLALALGVDIQELWQLSGGNIGSAAQSEVLHRKGQGRLMADLYAGIERNLNDILPVDYSFKFTYKDENEDKERAELARIWVDAVTVAGDNLTPDEARRVLANQVEGFHDAITDEEGELIRVDDLDVQPEDEIQDAQGEVVVDANGTETVEGTSTAKGDATQIFGYHIEQGVVTRNEVRATLGLPELPEPEGKALLELKEQLNVVKLAVAAGVPLDKALQLVDLDIGELPEPKPVPVQLESDVEEEVDIEEEVDVEETKEYGATREKFVERVGDIIGTFVLDQNRPQFGIYMRRNMRVFGQKAFIDGLEEGGVTQTALDTDEKKQLMSWIARQSPFITRIGKEIKDGLVISDTAARAEMWANKSLREIYTTGMLSADANGMYQWDLGAAVEHCKTCLRLDGQIHRLKDWMRRGLWPGCDKLICKGFRCTCDWHKVTGRARGRF